LARQARHTRRRGLICGVLLMARPMSTGTLARLQDRVTLPIARESRLQVLPQQAAEANASNDSLLVVRRYSRTCSIRCARKNIVEVDLGWRCRRRSCRGKADPTTEEDDGDPNHER